MLAKNTLTAGETEVLGGTQHAVESTKKNGCHTRQALRERKPRKG